MTSSLDTPIVDARDEPERLAFCDDAGCRACAERDTRERLVAIGPFLFDYCAEHRACWPAGRALTDDWRNLTELEEAGEVERLSGLTMTLANGRATWRPAALMSWPQLPHGRSAETSLGSAMIPTRAGRRCVAPRVRGSFPASGFDPPLV